MKIASIRKGENETYGLVQDDKIATKDDITYATGVPIPINVRDFLFDGWLQEVKSNYSKIEELMKNFVIICSNLCNKTKIINEALKNIEPKNES